MIEQVKRAKEQEGRKAAKRPYTTPAEVVKALNMQRAYCVNFFGTNDFAWIEENNMKDYEQYKVG